MERDIRMERGGGEIGGRSVGGNEKVNFLQAEETTAHLIPRQGCMSECRWVRQREPAIPRSLLECEHLLVLSVSLVFENIHFFSCNIDPKCKPTTSFSVLSEKCSVPELEVDWVGLRRTLLVSKMLCEPCFFV